MATITKYETKAGPRYRVRYRKPDGSQTDKRGYIRKKDAAAFAATVEVSKLTGSFVEAAAGRALISELGDTRDKNRAATLKPSTWRVEHSEWLNRVKPKWGNWAVSSVRTSDVEAWIAELAADCSPSIVRRCHGMLHGILATAVKDQLVARNAAAGVALPRKVPKPRAYLTHVQVDAVASAADTDEHALLVRFLAYTGLRWGEMAALRVRNLDMLRRRVNVEQSVVVLKKREEAFTTPKTYERRSVPFPKFLATALAKQCEGRGRDSLLFGDGENALRTLHSQRSWLKAAIRGANEHGTTVPDFSPHSLRHTAASLAISAGASPKAVQRMLGHSSAAMTLDTYADLFEDDLDAVAAALDAARESKCGQKVGKAPAANKTKAPTPA